MVLCQPVINSKFEQPPNIKHHTFREVNREQLAQNWPATWTLPHGMRFSPVVIPWIRRTMLSAPTSSSASRMPRRTLKSKSGHLGSRTGSSSTTSAGEKDVSKPVTKKDSTTGIDWQSMSLVGSHLFIWLNSRARTTAKSTGRNSKSESQQDLR